MNNLENHTENQLLLLFWYPKVTFGSSFHCSERLIYQYSLWKLKRYEIMGTVTIRTQDVSYKGQKPVISHIDGSYINEN